MRKKRAVRERRIPAGLIVVLVTAAVFSPVIGHRFVSWDDNVNVYENPNFKPLTFMSVLSFWKKPFEHLYIPVTYTAWALQALVARVPGARGMAAFDPRVFHAANLLLHALSTLVVYAALRTLLSPGPRSRALTPGRDLPRPARRSVKPGESVRATGGRIGEEAMRPKEKATASEGDVGGRREDWAAGLGALLFALHPVQVESVAWVTGMKDVLCGLFSLVAMWQYLGYARRAGDRATVREARLHYALAALAYVLALLSKPSAITLPLVAFVLGVLVLGRSLKRTALELLPWAAVAVPWTILTSVAQRGEHMAFVPPIWARPLLAGDTLAFYLYKLVAPVSLGADYGRTPKYVLEHWWIYVTWAVPVALILLARLSKDWKAWWAAAAVFIIGLLPVSGLATFAFQSYSTVADRYLYFSMLGPALALAWFIYTRPSPTFRAASAVLIALLTVLSVFQTRHWADGSALFKHALAVNPRSSVAYYNLGLEYAAQDKLNEAIRRFTRALEIRPDYDRAHNNLGVALAGLGKLEEGIGHLREAIRIKPDYAMAHYNLGVVLVAEGNDTEAVEHFREAVDIWPEYLEAQIALGRTLMRQGLMDEAVTHFSEAVRIEPDNADAHLGLGMSLGNTGRVPEAIDHLRKAAELKPEDPEIRNNLAVALYISGDYEGAWEQVVLCQEHGGIPSPDFVDALARKLGR